MKERLLTWLKNLLTVKEEDDDYEEEKYTIQLTFAVPADNAEYAIKDMKRRLVKQLNYAWDDNECEFSSLEINKIETDTSKVIPLVGAESLGDLPA